MGHVPAASWTGSSRASRRMTPSPSAIPRGPRGTPRASCSPTSTTGRTATTRVKAIAIPPGWKSLIILPVDHSFAHTAGLYTALVCGLSLYFVDSRGGGIGNAPQHPHQPAGGPAALHLHRPLALRQPHEEDHRRGRGKGRAHREALQGRNRRRHRNERKRLQSPWLPRRS